MDEILAAISMVTQMPGVTEQLAVVSGSWDKLDEGTRAAMLGPYKTVSEAASADSEALMDAALTAGSKDPERILFQRTSSGACRRRTPTVCVDPKVPKGAAPRRDLSDATPRDPS